MRFQEALLKKALEEYGTLGKTILKGKIHRVHSKCEVAAIVKLEARNQLQTLRQGAFESVISYKQQYGKEIKAYHDQGNPTKDDTDQAMDFFHSLDNGRYAKFKVQYLNGLQVKSINVPKNLNKIFTLANNWLKAQAQVAARRWLRQYLCYKGGQDRKETRGW